MRRLPISESEDGRDPSPNCYSKQCWGYSGWVDYKFVESHVSSLEFVGAGALLLLHKDNAPLRELCSSRNVEEEEKWQLRR